MQDFNYRDFELVARRHNKVKAETSPRCNSRRWQCSPVVVSAGLRRRARRPYLPRQLLHHQTQHLLDCSGLRKAAEGARRGVEEAAAAGAYDVPCGSVLAPVLRACCAGRPVDVNGRGPVRSFDPSNPASDPVSPPENNTPVSHTLVTRPAAHHARLCRVPKPVREHEGS